MYMDQKISLVVKMTLVLWNKSIPVSHNIKPLTSKMSNNYHYLFTIYSIQGRGGLEPLPESFGRMWGTSLTGRTDHLVTICPLAFT